jgi:hypothetical protein
MWRRCWIAALLTPGPANEAKLSEWTRACDLPNVIAFTLGLGLNIDAVIAAVTLPFTTARPGA